MSATPAVDVAELEARVKDMYRQVAEEPAGDYHFELGRSLAEDLGYPADVLDRIPDQSTESFAGVGYFFDLAELAARETVVDLGSGSGMDVLFAATPVGAEGKVIGIDFTESQLEKARRLAEAAGFAQVDLREGRIEDLPFEDESADCVISNGVINLAPDKHKVFAEAARVLRPGGRLVIADIVSEEQLKASIVCNAELWAACIGGAAQEDAYRQAIEGSGLEVEEIKENPYRFISERAVDASTRYGVKSVSIRARKR